VGLKGACEAPRPSKWAKMQQLSDGLAADTLSWSLPRGLSLGFVELDWKF
jgi:hypothetical protein